MVVSCLDITRAAGTVDSSWKLVQTTPSHAARMHLTQYVFGVEATTVGQEVGSALEPNPMSA